MAQNTIGQSDSRIFRLTISLEQNDEIVWSFECQYKFMKDKSGLKNILVSMGENGNGQSGHRNILTL